MKDARKLTTAEWLEISQRYEPSCMNWQAPVVWDHGLGAEVWDVDGKHYFDWTSGVLVANVGHAHPKLAEAIASQAKRLLNTFDFPTAERLSLAQKLIEKTPPHLDKVIFMTTGAEAMDAALRMARKATGNYEIVSFWGGFHGRSFGPMSVTGLPKIKKHFGPLLPGTILAPYPYCYRCPFEKSHPDCDLFCLDFLDKVVETETAGYLAGLIVEPYQGTAGFVFPPDGYMKKLEEWTKKKGLVFILDEVQSSYGRTGKMWALEHENLKPDILCLGKGIGSGAPISAVISTSKIFSSLSTGEMSSTMGGNPLSCAGALAVLEIMDEERLVEKAAKNGELLKSRLLDLCRKSSGLSATSGAWDSSTASSSSRAGKPKSRATDLARDIVAQAAWQDGLMCGKLGLYGNVMRVAPPLVITPEQIEKSASILEKVLEAM